MIMKKNYSEPAVEIALLAGMTLMQSASPSDSGMYTDISTDDQW